MSAMASASATHERSDLMIRYPFIVRGCRRPGATAKTMTRYAVDLDAAARTEWQIYDLPTGKYH